VTPPAAGPLLPPGAPHPGLCAGCRHHRWTGNRRGSSFLLCALSRVDARFPRYPQLPVFACAGFAPGEPDAEPDEEEA
jgi:hypothetical protein